MTKNLPAAPDWFDARKIIGQYLEGKKTPEIAQALGTSREKLIYHLITREPENWQEAQVIEAIKRSEEADDEIDKAGDLLALRKAEAKLKSAQWKLERVCRKIYGDSKPPESAQAVQININLRRESQEHPVTLVTHGSATREG